MAVDEGVGEAAPMVGLRWCRRCGSAAVDGASEAASVVGLRMVLMTRICDRGRGVRSCSGGWVKGGVDDADLWLWMGRQKLLR